jgi:hypothetical protein
MTQQHSDETYSPTGTAIDSEVDVMSHLQGIRAHFKLLTKQLGIPHVSLRQVMTTAAATTSPTTPSSTHSHYAPSSTNETNTISSVLRDVRTKTIQTDSECTTSILVPMTSRNKSLIAMNEKTKLTTDW